METTKKISETRNTMGFHRMRKSLKITASVILILMLTTFLGLPASAHCDSYDGPVVKDAMKALETNNVNLVLKWVNDKQEQEIISLFNKTYSLRNGDKEIYAIVEKHFLETLVRFHRETEGAPYTGLKPAGTTKIIVQMSDQAIATDSADDMIGKYAHIDPLRTF